MSRGLPALGQIGDDVEVIVERREPDPPTQGRSSRTEHPREATSSEEARILKVVPGCERKCGDLRGGTEGSNPSPSSMESGANLRRRCPSGLCGCRRRIAAVPTCVGPNAPPKYPT